MDSEMKAVRWRQRFQNFGKAYLLLEKSVHKPDLSEIERGGLIQFFEVTFELAWKLLKDFLETEGFKVKSPKEAFKQAYQSGLIQEGHLWMEALENRNLTTHTYDEATSLKIEGLIRHDYFPILQNLYQTFQKKHTT